MANGVLLLLVLVLPAAVVLAAALGIPRLMEGRRQKAYAAFALLHDYQYVPERRNATASYAEVVGLFKSGLKHSWRDEISGQFGGRPFTAFEYAYRTGAGRWSTALSRAMIHWRLDGTSLPRFSLEPASAYLFRIGRDPRVIEFPEDRAFAKAYVLGGEAHDAIRAVFTGEVRAALVAMPAQFVAAQGGDLFWWRERRLPPPDELDAFLTEGSQVAEVFAAHPIT